MWTRSNELIKKTWHIHEQNITHLLKNDEIFFLYGWDYRIECQRVEGESQKLDLSLTYEVKRNITKGQIKLNQRLEIC